MATGARVFEKSRSKESKPQDLPLEERIRRRAHEIYLQRGGQDGSELDDWLQAEEEIKSAESATGE